MFRFSFFLPVVFLVATVAPAQTPHRDANLTIEEVVKLVHAGFSEEVIVTKIKRNGKAFDLSTAELVDLKKEGVSDNLIKFLLDPSQPYNAPAPPSTPVGSSSAAPPPIGKKYPEDALASRVPSDPGLYIFSGNTPAKIDLKVLLGAEVGKMPLKKGRAVAYLVGTTAKMRTTVPKPAFYLRLPDGKELADVVLVLFKKKSDRREIDVGRPGPKQELKAEAIRQFDSLEVGQKLFRLVPQRLDPGEYIFFLIGSAEPPKGVYGKGFDFGIDKTEGASKVSPEKAHRP